MKVGIIGMGHVGTATSKVFPDAIQYDPYKSLGTKDEINRCDVAFICVPTPCSEDGSCDTSIVEDVFSWLETELIIIRSTIYVGFCDEIAKKTGKNIVFQPEYYGETVNHPFADMNYRPWVVLGGPQKAIDMTIRLYQTVYSADIRIVMTDYKTAELAKYMENAFLATKVTFCNEFYDLAQAFGVDYHQMREVFVADPRMNRSHTFVYPENRGFGGKCLPKDVSSIVQQGREKKIDVGLLSEVLERNKRLRGE